MLRPTEALCLTAGLAVVVGLHTSKEHLPARPKSACRRALGMNCAQSSALTSLPALYLLAPPDPPLVSVSQSSRCRSNQKATALSRPSSTTSSFSMLSLQTAVAGGRTSSAAWRAAGSLFASTSTHPIMPHRAMPCNVTPHHHEPLHPAQPLPTCPAPCAPLRQTSAQTPCRAL